jgi:uncharacterized repeat protein (TIGR03803 family)
MSTLDSKTVHGRQILLFSFLGLFWMLDACSPSFGQLVYQQIKVFPPGDIPGSASTDPTMGADPLSQLTEGSDGKLYGTASTSDFEDFDGFQGSVFRVNKDGSNFTPLWKFGKMPNDGSNSWAGVVQGIDGSLYGTTYFGGSNNLGTVFRLTSAGNGGYTNKILKSFTGVNGDGANPACKLIFGTDGFLYGTTVNGGTNNTGTIFKLLPAGGSFITVRSLATASLDGAHPYAGVVQGTNGMLFGTCSNGGPNNAGVVFRISTNGTGYTNIRGFGGAGDGTNAIAGLVCDTNNTLYGVTWKGGTSGLGTLFKINGDGTSYAKLTNFTGTANVPGSLPLGSPIIGADGLLYGTTSFGGAHDDGVIYRINKGGSGYTVLHDFDFESNVIGDGYNPHAGLVQGSDGGFYGTTLKGGTNQFGGEELGTIFSLGFHPPNDNFANRIGLVGPDAIGSGFNLNATLEANEPGHTNLVMTDTTTIPVSATNSIWWSWSGVPNGLVSIVDDANTVDAIIDVYTIPTCTGPPSGLVNWWRGENNGADSAGANTAFLSNGVAFATGEVGRAFSFDGIDDVLGVNASAIAPPWSAEFWVNRQATTNDSAVLIGDNATALKLEQYPNTKKVGYTIWGVRDYNFTNSSPLPIGTWTHLVFVGSTTNIQLYVNGAFVDSINTNWTLPRGTIGYDVARGNKKQLKGLLDEISLYNRMLTPGEIQSLYNAGGAGKCSGAPALPVDLTNLMSVASSTAPHSGLSNRVSFFANSTTTYYVSASGTVDENRGPTFAGSGPISLSMRTLDLRMLSVNATSNSDSTTTFTNCNLQIGNSGSVARGPLRVELIAEAGLSTAASSNAGAFRPPDRLLSTWSLINPTTLAANSTTNIFISGICPGPTNYVIAGTTNAIGWGVFAQLEEQVGTNWFTKDKDLVLYSVWPTNNGFPGPGGGVIRINPTGGTGIVLLTNTSIIGPLSVNEGTTNAYQGFVRFSDGGTFTFSNTVWTASRFAITTNGLFHSDPITSNTAVTLGCYYVYDNKTNNATTNITVLDLPSPRLTNFTILPSKQFQFAVNGVPGRLHVIEATTNLGTPTIWTAIATNATTPGGTFIFTDPGSSSLSRRFYRAHEQ